ncbi:MAG TPA: GAF domain-containing sensor histidine kinase [Longimicrobiales bacterium]|nr:GAF domain-containing sensor histidine kinase [Longimicrobiales bacterium]
MDVTAAVLGIHESDSSTAAYGVLSHTLQPPLHAVVRIDSSQQPTILIPPGTALSAELTDTAAHLLRPEVFGLRSQFPTDASSFPDTDVLLIPYRVGEDSATAVLIGESGSFGEDPEPWRRLAGALARMEQREQSQQKLRAECELLRQRAEESEAMHTLGLATNRSLDPDEVLALVARFARTLLGAHYATVSTVKNDTVELVASIGLHGEQAGTDELAARIVEASKPLRIGGADANLDPAEFPLHVQQGMVVGLGIPLTLFGDTFGALVVGYRRPYEVTARDVRLGISVATHAAVAIGNARLHERVEQRSSELAQAYAQLGEATSAKERFYNAVSHDLRTPVGAIKGYSELMLEGLAGELPERARRFIENSARAAENLLSLLNDLLDFAKLQANRVEIDMKPTDLRRIVDDALLSVRPQAEEKGLELVEPQNCDLTLVTDGRRLRQILVNLLGNAVKFTKSGRIGLECAADSDFVELAVFDTGPGIAPDDQARVFREFEQIKGSVGTGLGLPICANLASLLGGFLHVESEPGTGSRFVLRLPLEPLLAGTPVDDDGTAILPGDDAPPSTMTDSSTQPPTGRRGAVQVS